MHLVLQERSGEGGGALLLQIAAKLRLKQSKIYTKIGFHTANSSECLCLNYPTILSQCIR